MNAKLKVELLEDRIVPAGMEYTLDRGMISGYTVSAMSQVDTIAAPTAALQPGGRTVCNDNVCYYVVTMDPAS